MGENKIFVRQSSKKNQITKNKGKINKKEKIPEYPVEEINKDNARVYKKRAEKEKSIEPAFKKKGTKVENEKPIEPAFKRKRTTIKKENEEKTKNINDNNNV